MNVPDVASVSSSHLWVMVPISPLSKKDLRCAKDSKVKSNIKSRTGAKKRFAADIVGKYQQQIYFIKTVKKY
jgi:hypothetical protein